MKVTLVSLCATPAATRAGRPALTPELLATTGARYSRNNEGLQSILQRIDPDRSVDSIFRMVDYGHQSIADMAPVAMFIDGISLWLAYYLWTLSPTAGGQESSTRYIRMEPDSMLSAADLGIPPREESAWNEGMQQALRCYATALEVWQSRVDQQPSLARIPRHLLEDAGEKTARQVQRMRRNYAFDRARYYLPLGLATNVMLVMAARGWVQLIRTLLCHPLHEARSLGDKLRQELELVTPRLLRHAVANPALCAGLDEEWNRLVVTALHSDSAFLQPGTEAAAHPAEAFLEVMAPDASDSASAAPDFAAELRYHDNRYGWAGPELRRTAVRFGWAAVAMGDIRDLNRHRTGHKHCPLLPLGFYGALDQVPAQDSEAQATLTGLAREGRRLSALGLDLLRTGEPTYVYRTLLGTQYRFEHITTADKFLYEAELRTGAGAHYRYAQHLHDALGLWYARYPATRGLVLEGSAEPE